MKHCLVVPTQNCRAWDLEDMQWCRRNVKHMCKTFQAQLCLDDALANPIPLELANVLHEEGMRYHSVITIVIQGANDFHPECHF